MSKGPPTRRAGATPEAAQAGRKTGIMRANARALALAPIIAEIQAQRPDMVLLTGGTDGGDSVTFLHNARLLARSALSVPIVLAGNQAVIAEALEILTNGGKEVRCATNVMPRSGHLAVESAREEIRKLFMERITHAKGMDALRGFVPVILPTPMAVLQGALLGAQGSEHEQGWGDLLVVDVGGATTDVHSIGYGQATGPQIVEQGLPESFAKRTVEGDLGIRFNAVTLLDRVGLDAQAGDMPWHCVNLAGKAGHPEGVDHVAAGDHDVDRNACRQVQDVSGLDPAIVGIAEGPQPLLSLCFDPHRRRGRQRQQPLASDQSVADERRQDDGRHDEATEHYPTPRRHARAPARTPDHQREQYHHKREENCRTDQHHPP